jgi:hypothetical protein
MGPPPEYPGDHVAADHFQFRTENYLACVDVFSGYPFLFHCRSVSAAAVLSAVREVLWGNFPLHRRKKPTLQALDARTTGEGCPHYRRRLPAAENLVKAPEFVNLIWADPLPRSRSQCDSLF